MIGINDFIIVDDAICPQYQDMIENWLLSTSSTWSFVKDVALHDHVIENLNLESRPGFSKTLFSVKNARSNDLYPMILPMVFEAGHKAGINVNQVLFSRSFLTMPVPNDTPNTFDHVHVDTNDDHIVCLYYANDTDGDTVFFDWTVPELLEDPDVKKILEQTNYDYHDQRLMEMLDAKISKKDYNVIKRVSPKKGRAVFFNGHRYHSSTRCTSGYRLVINTCFRV